MKLFLCLFFMSLNALDYLPSFCLSHAMAFKYTRFCFLFFIFCFFLYLYYKDLTQKQKERQRKKEREGGGKVSAGLPDASRQVSVHTVL